MATFKPASAADLQEAIAQALRSGETLEVIGMGSKREIGRPSKTVHALDLSLLRGILSYEPEELVLSAKAATPLSEIESALASARQILAFEPPDYSLLLSTGSGSLAGAFACNFAGPRRFKAGAARDFLLGFSGVNGRGEAFKAGGRVVKNVTGYDLAKLMCGSWGTLAVMSEVTLKVLPAAETEASVGLAGLSHAEAVKVMATALRSSAEASGAAYAPDAPGEKSRTMLRLEGIEASVKARAQTLLDLLKAHGKPFMLDEASSRAFWREMRDVGPLAEMRDAHIWRLSVPPADSAEVMAEIGRTVAARYYCDWGGGLVWIAAEPRDDAHAGAIRAAVSRSGGHATLIRAPEAVRRSVPVFQPQPQALAELTRRVKAAFDPERVLNPSRMYEGV
jgi:glycolate oxidase FAD binding subunit